MNELPAYLERESFEKVLRELEDARLEATSNITVRHLFRLRRSLLRLEEERRAKLLCYVGVLCDVPQLRKFGLDFLNSSAGTFNNDWHRAAVINQAALLMLHEGQYEEARQAYEGVLRTADKQPEPEPQYDRIRLNYSTVLFGLGEITKSAEVLARARPATAGEIYLATDLQFRISELSYAATSHLRRLSHRLYDVAEKLARQSSPSALASIEALNSAHRSNFAIAMRSKDIVGAKDALHRMELCLVWSRASAPVEDVRASWIECTWAVCQLQLATLTEDDAQISWAIDAVKRSRERGGFLSDNSLQWRLWEVLDAFARAALSIRSSKLQQGIRSEPLQAVRRSVKSIKSLLGPKHPESLSLSYREAVLRRRYAELLEDQRELYLAERSVQRVLGSGDTHFRDSLAEFGSDEVLADLEKYQASFGDVKASQSIAQAAVDQFGSHSEDTGSTEVQIAILSRRIADLTLHLKGHPQDHHSRRGLLLIVGRRRRLLQYLADVDLDRYRRILRELNLRR